MSKYTTEVRYICEVNAGLTESVGADEVDNIIEASYAKIFDFNFPIFDEDYRSILIKKILMHYYTREIGLETVGLWKLKLKTKLNEIMPYYNQLYKSELIEFDPLNSYNMKREYKKYDTGTVNTKTDDTRTTAGQYEDLEKYSDTPQGAVDGLLSDNYLTNATHTNGTNSGSDTLDGTQVKTNDLTTTYLETIIGFSNKSPSKSIKEYRDNFLNIDMMVINELEELFFQLW